MQLQKITETYTAAPQVQPSDMPAIAEAGFTTVICNRPDGEIPPALQAAAMQEAAEQAGLTFVYNPVTHAGLSHDTIAEQADAIAASDGPVLAYCNSGTRSTVVWAFAMAGTMPVDEIIAGAAQGGYQLAGLRPQLQAMAGAAGRG